MNRYSLLLCSDDNYICNLATTVESVISCRRTNYPIDVYVISDNISLSNRNLLRDDLEKKNVTIEFIDTGEKFDGATVNGHLTISTYSRLLAPDLLPNVDKILYLDCDVVARDDLKELFDFPLGDNLLAGSPAIDFRKHVMLEKGIGYDRLVKGLGFTVEEVGEYVGAGIVLMNLKAMREEEVVEKFAKYIKAHSREDKFIRDQETLNVVCKGKVARFHPKFHLALSHLVDIKNIYRVLESKERSEFDFAVDEPSLVHYCGKKKPWDDPSMKFASDYWFHRRHTPWRVSWPYFMALNLKSYIKKMLP